MNNMKTTKKTLALLLLAVAAGNVAQAQMQYLEADKAYVFKGTAASGTGNMSYQWYRDGEPIEGATEANYTLRDELAVGTNVEFKRKVVSDACPYSSTFTNTVTITFTGLKINGVKWAQYNVAAVNTFAAKPDMYTEFYQWNRLTAWADTGSVSGWSGSGISRDTFWTVNPCPNGWRLPTQLEFQALYSSGTTWVAANSARGNVVAGRFFGPNHTTTASCKLPNPMVNCIFLPAVGFRDGVSGLLTEQDNTGIYWSSTHYKSASVGNHGYTLNFNYTTVLTDNHLYKASGFPVRCVR